jgi:hypothetical protein
MRHCPIDALNAALSHQELIENPDGAAKQASWMRARRRSLKRGVIDQSFGPLRRKPADVYF